MMIPCMWTWGMSRQRFAQSSRSSQGEEEEEEVRLRISRALSGVSWCCTSLSPK